MSRTNSRDPNSTQKKRGSAGGEKKIDVKIDQDLWPCRTFQVRQWGHLLEKKQGSHQGSVKKLLTTLKDGRTLTEQPLRLTALQRLTPAAATGHRGALAAQAHALLDRRKVVRECALDSLWEAAGNQRPEPGGAVHAQLQDVLPPEDAGYQMESRRAAADALMRLGPRGDETLLSIVRGWLDDEDPEVRALASQAIGFMGSSAADVDRLAPLLQDKNWRVVKACIDALEQISGGDGVRHKCRRGDTKELPSRRMSGQSGSSRSSSKLSMSKTMPSLLGDINSNGGSRPNTPSRLETPEQEQRAGSKRSTRSGGSKRSANSDQSRETWSEGGGMPRPSSTLLAVSCALATPCLGEGGSITEEVVGPRLLWGLPRADAVASLRRVAPWGHHQSLEAVAARLRDTDAEVRKEAVAAVAELAPGNRTQAFDLCGWAMEELDWRARAAAVEALAASAPGGDEEAFQVAADLLEGSEWAPRRGAISALRALVLSGEEEEQRNDRIRKLDLAIEAVTPKLQHEHWSVRRFAVLALCSVCEVIGGHRKGLKRVKEMVNDPDEQVRLALAANLGRVAPLKSKEAVVTALQLASTDDDVEVRVAALLAVEELCGDERSRTRKAVRQVAALFADEEEEVRLTAKRVICAIGRERRCAVDALTLVLKDPNEYARLLAADTFKSVVGKLEPRAMKRTMRLVRRSSVSGVREAAAKAMAFCQKETEAHVEQDPKVILAASKMAMKWRMNRFKGLRGNMLSQEERLANYAARGEDPSKDQEWLEVFGPPVSKQPKHAKGGKKPGKPKPKKRKNSQQSNSMASRGETSSQASESELGDESDDNRSTTSKQSDASESSRVSKASKQSSQVSSKPKGRSGIEIRRQQAEEKERKQQDKERQQRFKEMHTIMESSDEEDFSESGTEEESDDDDMMTAVEKILAGGTGRVR